MGIEKMLRMYFLQLRFGLSDEGVEDAIYDSRAFSRFMGVSFGLGDQAPDATTLLKFRRIIEANGLAGEILGRVNAVQEAKGVMMRGGSIVDATFIEAPSSTKNAGGSRDPEMHQGRKGKNWHFGMKAHIGVDAGSGLVHTAAFTPANVSDIAMAHALVREDDGFCYADSWYTGASKRPEVAGDPAAARRSRKIGGGAHREGETSVNQRFPRSTEIVVIILPNETTTIHLAVSFFVQVAADRGSTYKALRRINILIAFDPF